ncbi:MAG TPA: hypothetical protein VIM94_10910 [Salegentibacter sp.]|uniref:hypothetical protein n=1 Tax=Salegentibacter sp. TaxID=1903072 RepID=UPI002F939D1A
MKQIKRLCFFLTILTVAISCETETEISDKGESAKLYYTPDCATINGYIILDGSNETYVFQHEIDEQFQETEIDVWVQYDIETEPIPLTAECTQADVIIINSLQKK